MISSTDDYPKDPRHNKALTKSPYVSAFPVKGDGKGFAITFIHLGRNFYQITLWASTYVSQRKWVENITKQQNLMRARSTVFDTVPLSEGFFIGSNKVNCAAPYNGGRRIVYGTDEGVYLSDMREPGRDPVKVLGLLDVMQVEVLDDYQLLIVLSERQVITFPLDALDPMDPLSGLKRAKRISSHTTFFKAGVCLGKVLVCVVKSSPLSSTIKTLEPIDQNIRGRSKPTFRKLLQGGNDTLKLFRVCVPVTVRRRDLIVVCRSFIYPSSQARYISSRPNCVLGAQRASRSSTSRRSIRRACWTPRTTRSTLLRSARICGRWRYTELIMNSYYVMMVSDMHRSAALVLIVRRVRILCQSNRLAVAEGLHGALGGAAHQLR